jgi:hypothetical protein
MSSSVFVVDMALVSMWRRSKSSNEDDRVEMISFVSSVHAAGVAWIVRGALTTYDLSDGSRIDTWNRRTYQVGDRSQIDSRVTKLCASGHWHGTTYGCQYRTRLLLLTVVASVLWSSDTAKRIRIFSELNCTSCRMQAQLTPSLFLCLHHMRLPHPKDTTTSRPI